MTRIESMAPGVLPPQLEGTPEQQWEQVVAYFATLRTVAMPCALCKALTSEASAIVPQNPQEWGAPPGKLRVLFFHYCGCQGPVEEAHPLIARRLLDRLQGREN